MEVIGLTGGIAAGKSTVARLFAELGCAVVDADQVARSVVAAGSPVLATLVEVFGREILAADGALDRPALGTLVFADPAARARLEGITHPAIAAASRARFEALAQRGEQVALYEAALLIETGRHEEMDGLIVVTADEARRLARLIERDGLSEREARQRLEAQWPQQRKAALADHVIDNSAGLDDTRRQVERVWRQVARESARRPKGAL
ncbi:MAG: dephospho-CoA kinase [Proteobacteria bacterium]|nr:MAG: dephospho-CoA kinase [Pseudomonadota bacterium]PIE18926.1 MAG: dephospho-CoA kinase [Pseudomonadota bacterium]